MSVPSKFKPEIADCCFCSHCFYLLALPGKRPVVVISCHKNTVNILITKTFIFYFVFAAKKIFPIRRNVVPGTIKTISFVYLSEPQPRRQPPFPNAPTSPTFPGLGSVGNVVGCAASALPFPPTLLPLFFRDFRFAGLCSRLPYFSHSNKIIEIRGLKQTVVHRGGQILQNPTGVFVQNVPSKMQNHKRIGVP